MTDQPISEADYCNERIAEVRKQLDQFKRGLRVRRGTAVAGTSDVTDEHVARLKVELEYWSRRLEIAEGQG